MVIIKRQKVRAYILLESLVAIGILAAITTLVLGQMDLNRQQMEDNLRRQEVLNVATMAVQTKQDKLTLNGVSVTIIRKGESIHVYKGDKLLLQVQKD